MTIRFTTRRGTSTRLSRTVAGFAITLIVMLMAGSASPEAHHHLCHHRDHHQHHPDGMGADANAGAERCIVAAFASGEAYALPVVFRTEPLATTWAETMRPREVGLNLAHVEHRLAPACGPPAALSLMEDGPPGPSV